jgi:hydrophobic/amphiphilic exporter-1 (mainly G- bacteria), HAE1 family
MITSLYTQVGLVLMIALASKNAILIVAFARDIQREGKSAKEAAVEATSRRFRPTGIGTVVFGGMLASTLLAIPFVPVLYVITQRLSERFREDKAQPSPGGRGRF